MVGEQEIKYNHQKTTTPKDFDDIAFKAIDETLSTLGEQSKTAIYTYLKKKYYIDKKEIPQRIEEFSKALEDLLKVGATQLEILCMQNLFIQLKNSHGEVICESTACNITFQEYTQIMKHKYTEKEK